MVKDWAKGPTAPIEPIPDQATFAQRRRALSQIFAGEMLVIPTGHEKVRSNDTHYRFRPATDFLLPHRLRRARLRAGDDPRGRRRPPRRALRRAEPGPRRRHLLHRPDQGRALGGPAPRRPREPGALRRPRVQGPPRLQGPARRARGRSAEASLRAPRLLPQGRRRPPRERSRQGPRHLPLGDAPAQGRDRDPRAARGDRLHQARLRGRDPEPAQGHERARGRGRLQPARAGRGATTSATGRSPPRARTPACSTGPRTTARSTRASSSCSTPGWRATRSTRPTSPAPSRSRAASPGSSGRSTSWFTGPRRPRSSR